MGRRNRLADNRPLPSSHSLSWQGGLACQLLVITALLAAGCSATATSSTLSEPTPLKCVVTTTLSPVTIGAEGGPGRASVVASRECAWAASSEAAWIIITDGQSGQGDGSLSFEVAANPSGAARTASIVVNDQRIALTQAAAPCRFTLDHSTDAFGSPGGSGGVVVITASGCEWTAMSLASWISITAGAAGAGSGTVAFTVASSSGGARRGEMEIAGRTFTVDQDAAGSAPAPIECTASISPTTLTASAAGGLMSVNISTPAACRWTATSTTPWLTLRSGSGTGASAVQIDVGANSTTTARTGSAMIGGRSLTVQQAAAVTPAPPPPAPPQPPPPPPSCSYSVSPRQLSVPAAGGSVSTTVDTQATCAWTAVSNVSWFAVKPGGRTGDGTIELTATANAGTSTRTGTATVAGVTVSLEQAGSPPPCKFRISPTEAQISRQDQTLSVSVDTVGGCAWHATSHNNWIDVTGASSGMGPGIVRLRVDENKSQNDRKGSVTIAGETFSITQAGRRSDLEELIVPFAVPLQPR